MLDGSFTLGLHRPFTSLSPDRGITEPLGEPHANYMGPRGARVVVIQPDPARLEFLRPFAGFLDGPTHRHDGGIATWAARLARELDATDDLSPLAAEGIVLEMFVHLARLDPARSGRPPAWLLRAQELLHDRFSEPLHSSDIARAVEVPPRSSRPGVSSALQRVDGILRATASVGLGRETADALGGIPCGRRNGRWIRRPEPFHPRFQAIHGPHTERLPPDHALLRDHLLIGPARGLLSRVSRTGPAAERNETQRRSRRSASLPCLPPPGPHRSCRPLPRSRPQGTGRSCAPVGTPCEGTSFPISSTPATFMRA